MTRGRRPRRPPRPPGRLVGTTYGLPRMTAQRPPARTSGDDDVPTVDDVTHDERLAAWLALLDAQRPTND